MFLRTVKSRCKSQCDDRVGRRADEDLTVGGIDIMLRDKGATGQMHCISITSRFIVGM